MSILNPGDELLVPEPMYVDHHGRAVLGGASCVTIPLREEDRFLLRAEEVKKYITDKTKVLILNSPHNPTGQVFDKEDLIGIAKLAMDHNFMIVSDDIYNREFCIKMTFLTPSRIFICKIFFASTTAILYANRLGYSVFPGVCAGNRGCE